MRPAALKTKIFLDSADPVETESILQILGFLDGQTTNPTLLAHHPGVRKRLESGKKLLSKSEVENFYRQVVREISDLIPHGSVSIEAYADKNTTAEDLIAQGEKMFSWIPNAHIKLPITEAGLEAASELVRKDMRVNMTLCFTQAQAGAVYAITLGAKRGDVLVSPFVGRLDDVGDNGMDLIKNILRLYGGGVGEMETRADRDGHVEVVAASIRSTNQLLAAVALGTDIVTAPYHVLKEWGEAGLQVPGPDYEYEPAELKPIPYMEYYLDADWHTFNVKHALTEQGIEKFAKDWNNLIQ